MLIQKYTGFPGLICRLADKVKELLDTERSCLSCKSEIQVLGLDVQTKNTIQKGANFSWRFSSTEATWLDGIAVSPMCSRIGPLHHYVYWGRVKSSQWLCSLSCIQRCVSSWQEWAGSAVRYRDISWPIDTSLARIEVMGIGSDLLRTIQLADIQTLKVKSRLCSQLAQISLLECVFLCASCCKSHLLKAQSNPTSRWWVSANTCLLPRQKCLACSGPLWIKTVLFVVMGASCYLTLPSTLISLKCFPSVVTAKHWYITGLSSLTQDELLGNVTQGKQEFKNKATFILSNSQQPSF